MARSINKTQSTLWEGFEDEFWLELLDRLDPSGGIVIVEHLPGQKDNPETKVFAGYRLNPSQVAMTRCIVKIGPLENIRREYDGWHCFLQTQPRPESCSAMMPFASSQLGDQSYGALLTYPLGSEGVDSASLLESWRERPNILSAVIPQLLDEALKNLHEYDQAEDGRLGFETRSAGTALSDRITGNRLGRIRQSLEGDEYLLSLLESAEIGPSDQLLANYGVHTVPNHIRSLLEDGTIGASEVECSFPSGPFHGDPNFSNIFVSRGQNLRVGLIDFEHCRLSPRPYCPFDDLARLEWELLFTVPQPHGVLPLALAAAYLPWQLDTGFPLFSELSERDAFAALQSVRRRARELSTRCGADELASFERGYYVCLMARALVTLGYGNLPAQIRACIYHFALLLSLRLHAADQATFTPRYSEMLVVRHTVGDSDHTFDGHVHTLRVAQRGRLLLAVGSGVLPLRAFSVEVEFSLVDMMPCGLFGCVFAPRTVDWGERGVLVFVQREQDDRVFFRCQDRDRGGTYTADTVWTVADFLRRDWKLDVNTEGDLTYVQLSDGAGRDVHCVAPFSGPERPSLIGLISQHCTVTVSGLHVRSLPEPLLAVDVYTRR